MHKLTVFVAAASFTLVAGFACGGEDEGGDGGFSVPDSTVLGTLTDAQTEAVCKDTKAYYSSSGFDQDFKEMTCRITGLLAAGQAAEANPLGNLAAACQGPYDQCIAGAMPLGCPTFTSTCMATVGEYRACLAELAGASDPSLKLIPPCAEVTLLSLVGLAGLTRESFPPTPLCDAFEEKCPDVELPIPDLPF